MKSSTILKSFCRLSQGIVIKPELFQECCKEFKNSVVSVTLSPNNHTGQDEKSLVVASPFGKNEQIKYNIILQFIYKPQRTIITASTSHTNNISFKYLTLLLVLITGRMQSIIPLHTLTIQLLFLGIQMSRFTGREVWPCGREG